MGRSQKWPDLRSPISKIRDIRFVGTDDLIIFRKFHNFPWNIVAVARWETYFVVGSLDLTWWPDLKLRKGCSISYGKFQHDPPNGVASSSEKLMGGLHQPPLTGRGLMKASKRLSPIKWYNRTRCFSAFFLLPFVEKIYLSWSSDDYHWKEQRLEYKIGK